LSNSDGKHPEAAQFNAVASGHCVDYLIKNDTDDPLNLALVKMSVR